MVQPGVSALGKKKRTTGLPRNCFRETGFPFSSGKVNSGALSLTCMGNSPFRSSLYRMAGRAVTCAGLVLVATGALNAQFARKTAVSKGPRAVGLLVMPAKGKPRLIPVAIMVDGRFYDAGAYKADPVPLALEQGTVYEAERTGDSLGLFTVNQVLQQKNNWIAEGTYHAKGEKVESTAHKAETTPREEKDEGPPVLRRPGSAPPKPANPPAPPPESKPASTPTPATNDTSSAKVAPAPKAEPEPEDSNIPKLRRGAPEPRAATEVESSTPPKPASSSAGKSSAPGKSAGTGPAAPTPEVQMVPAISDADGPEPRSYGYEMKPEEEQAFRAKMLAMAGDELRKQAKEFGPEKPAPAARRRAGTKAAPKTPQPSFDDVRLHVFDVSSNNEPILVLTATAHPAESGGGESKLADYYVTLVARSDIYGELRKLLSVVTDSQRLDVNPRMQLIDVVDADGDGRGELLFRQISDAGSAYAIYRVTPDRLWPLYEGTPQ
jgi:hypothetical protein